MINTESKVVGRRGRESYSSDTLRAKRKARQFAADDRQAIYDDLTLNQRLALAKSRRGESKREVARIQNLIKGNSNAKQRPA